MSCSSDAGILVSSVTLHMMFSQVRTHCWLIIVSDLGAD